MLSVSKRKLLLADDSITIQKVVNLTFADEGIEVVAVSDGDAAMERFQSDAPDLVLADVNMPGLDGYRICETIKNSADTKHIPVILLVGSFEPFDEAEARRVGADDFLTKPFQSIRLLVSKVADLLDGKTAAGDADNAETVSSFDDTLRIETPIDEETEQAAASAENFDDAALDDEMIQTNQIGHRQTDEAQNYESEPTFESSVEDIDFGNLKQPYEYASLSDYEAENDLGKTQPLSGEDLEEISGAAGEENYAQPEDAADGSDEDEGFAPRESARARNFDELNLLDLPPERRNLSAAGRAARGEYAKQAEAKRIAEQAVKNLSPETLDAIAGRVAELVLDRVVEQVAAQMAEEK